MPISSVYARRGLCRASETSTAISPQRRSAALAVTRSMAISQLLAFTRACDRTARGASSKPFITLLGRGHDRSDRKGPSSDHAGNRGSRSVGVGDRRWRQLLVRAAARSIGFAADHARQLLSALLVALGPDGTLLAYAHTGDQYLWRRDASRFFTTDAPNITGGLAAAMLAHPGAFRSRHPTNSWVGIGPNAR